MSEQGALVGIVTDSKTGERLYFLAEPLDMTFSQVRYGYRNSSGFRSSLSSLTESIRKMSGGMYDLSVQEGANLSVMAALFSSDKEVLYVAENGSTSVPLSYTMR